MIKVDVIIPVYQPTEKLEKMLLALSCQTYKPEHIFLMHTEDGYGLEAAKEICTKIPCKEVEVSKADFDHGGTRNLGIQNSSAEIVICMTQDAIPANALMIEKLVQSFEQDEKIAVSYARQKAGKGCSPVEAYTRRFNYPLESVLKDKNDLETMGIKTYFCSNVCAAYKRNVYLELGGFEQPVIFNEDMIYAARAIHKGYKIFYAADAVVLHSHHYSGKMQIKRNFDLGVSQQCYPEIFSNIKSETEGVKLVKDTTGYLIKIKRPHLIIPMLWQSGCKYLGYQLGKHYEKLPNRFIMKLTMNPEFWRKRRSINGTKKKA